MSTFMANAKTVTRKWFVLDAAGQPLGHTAALAAHILRGKHKPDFTPHVDCGDFVIIINTEKAVLTGKKLDQKYYRRHSGWVGGLKEVKYRHLMENRPSFAMELAVKGMLPKNALGAQMFRRLKATDGAEHAHAAQKPEIWAQG
ncbi:50S ribosomal protein L13 [Oscillospiraceae bacterium OttesenSCG-928-F05]|nr:50S ribosomal protein L13 [Oscillospiraceae bacterium OttesenSCG-928-F05]